jgi:hypothetical protein
MPRLGSITQHFFREGMTIKAMASCTQHAATYVLSPCIPCAVARVHAMAASSKDTNGPLLDPHCCCLFPLIPSPAPSTPPRAVPQTWPHHVTPPGPVPTPPFPLMTSHQPSTTAPGRPTPQAPSATRSLAAAAAAVQPAVQMQVQGTAPRPLG